MSWFQLFLTNLKMLYRNWRGLFWTIAFPLGLYIGLSVIKLSPNIGGQKIDYSTYLLPGMIALTIAQTGVFSLAYWLVDLKERGVLKRLQATPLSDFEMLSALISTRLVVMLVQVGLLTIIGGLFFHVHFAGSLLSLIILCIFGGICFLSIGFLISTISKNYDEAAPITTIVNLVFTFLGNIFFPSSVLPASLRSIAAKLPITYLADGLRNAYLGTSTFANTGLDLLALIIWMVILFGCAIYMLRRVQKA